MKHPAMRKNCQGINYSELLIVSKIMRKSSSTEVMKENREKAVRRAERSAREVLHSPTASALRLSLSAEPVAVTAAAGR